MMSSQIGENELTLNLKSLFYKDEVNIEVSSQSPPLSTSVSNGYLGYSS